MKRNGTCTELGDGLLGRWAGWGRRGAAFLVWVVVASGLGFAQAGEALRIACVGDSITEGSNAPGRDWPAQFALMAEQFAPGKYQVGNFGKGGATLLPGTTRPYRAQSQYGESLAFRPQWIVLNLGINDSNHGFWSGNREEFRRSLKELIEVYQALDSRPRIWLSTLTKMNALDGNFEATVGKRATVDRVVREVAAEYGLDVIDFGAATAGIQNLFPDGLHPDGDGYTVMAETVFDALFGQAMRTRRSRHLEAVFGSAFEQGEFAGNVLATERGEVLLEASYGTALPSTGTKLSESTMFTMGSASRMFTAALVMRLVQQGKCELEDPVTKFWVEFPYPAITLRHLLVHASGLPSVASVQGDAPTPQGAELCKRLITTKPELEREPGGEYDENDLNDEVLVQVVERVVKQSFAQAMRREVFEAVGMKTAWLPVLEVSSKGPASGAADGVKDAQGSPEFEAGRTLVRTGDVCLTARELLQFDQALWDPNGNWLSEASRGVLWQPARLADGTAILMRGWSPSSLGLGLWLDHLGQSVHCSAHLDGHVVHYQHWIATGRTLIVLQAGRSEDWTWLRSAQSTIAAKVLKPE